MNFARTVVQHNRTSIRSVTKCTEMHIYKHFKILTFFTVTSADPNQSRDGTGGRRRVLYAPQLKILSTVHSTFIHY